MRDRVNIPIDPKLKQMFEDLKENLRTTWTEVLEDAIRERIIQADPVRLLEHEIRMGDEKQEERRQVLIRAKSILFEIENNSNQKKDHDLELLRYREELFLKDERTLTFQWPEPNWTRIIDRYQFKNKSEAVEFLRKRIMHIKELNI